MGRRKIREKREEGEEMHDKRRIVGTRKTKGGRRRKIRGGKYEK